MSNLDLDAIKARAQAATPGPWRVGSNFIDNFPPNKDEYDVVVDVWTMDPSDDAEFVMSDDDKAFIEGMDPETTLALVEEVERLRGQCDLAYQAGRMVERGEIVVSEDE